MAIARSRRGAGHSPVIPATQARSGRLGVDVLWVLVVSTGLAAIALLAVLAIDAPSLSGPGGQASPNRPTISTPPSPVKQNAAG